MGRLKNLWQGFKGGPDFSQCSEVTAMLENTQLTLTLPASNISIVEPPRSINYPYKQTGWFDANSKQSRQHHYVHIDTQLWYYLPVGFLQMYELGVLSLSTQIKQVLPEKKIDGMDLNALGEYVIVEHKEFYNGAVGSHGQGENTRLIKHYQDEVRGAWGGSISEEEILTKAARRTPPSPYPPMSRQQIKTINGRDWVFCVEPKLNSYTHDNMYCLPLSKRFYLCLSFRHQVGVGEKYNKWKDHANAAEKRIMDTLRIENIGPKLLE